MRKLSRNILAGIAVAGIIMLVLFLGYREPTQWAKAYNRIENGMTFEQVNEIVDSIRPVEKSGEMMNTDSRINAISYIFYRGKWQYKIYFDEQKKVCHKVHWWD